MHQGQFKTLLTIKINLRVKCYFTDKEKPRLREVKQLSVVTELTKHYY